MSIRSRQTMKREKIVSIWKAYAVEQSLKYKKVQSGFYPGDLVTRTGDREIRSASGRLPDNPGELA